MPLRSCPRCGRATTTNANECRSCGLSATKKRWQARRYDLLLIAALFIGTIVLLGWSYRSWW